MKKSLYILFAVCALLLSCAALRAQTDSAAVETTTSYAIISDSDIGQINSEIKTVVLPAIFNLLGKVGINVTPFAGLLSILLMLLIRFIEKRIMKDRHAATLEEIVNDVSPHGKQPITEHHENRLKAFIKHLRGQ